MFKRISYLTFALLLLIQFTTCLPIPTATDRLENNNIPQVTTTVNPTVAVAEGHNSFEDAFFKGLINFQNFRLQRSNQIAKDVLADPSMNSIDSEAMEKERSVLRKYVQDSRESLNTAQPADNNYEYAGFIFLGNKDVVLQSFDRFKRRHASKTEAVTPEQQVAWDALKKHGVLEYDEEVDKRYKEYLHYLVDEFEAYVKTLSADDKEKAKDLIEAWNAYTKHERGMDKTAFGHRLFQISWKF
uniref:Pyridoxine/pyridoxamine 5'-phosphate oxidase n=2 Tax=Zeugodacus cucurbitae TaxID=28588 RepID=A0A0A1WYN0_ZEUCU